VLCASLQIQRRSAVSQTNFQLMLDTQKFMCNFASGDCRTDRETNFIRCCAARQAQALPSTPTPTPAPMSLDTLSGGHALADAVTDAAALLSQAAADIHLLDEPYLNGVNLLGRLCVWATALPWLRIHLAVLTLLAALAAAVYLGRRTFIEQFDRWVTRKVLAKMQERLAGRAFGPWLGLTLTFALLTSAQLGLSEAIFAVFAL